MGSLDFLSGLPTLRVSVRRCAERHRFSIVLTAIVAFAAFFVYSAAHLDLSIDTIRWGWLGWAAAIMPLALLANASELALCSRATGRAMPMPVAFSYSAGATIANVLPLPAGAMLRARALVGQGAGWAESGAIVAAAGLLWLTMATACVGYALMPGHAGTILLVAGGLASLLILGWIAWRADVVTGAAFLLVRGAMIVLLVLRLHFCFLAIGQPLALSDCAVFALAGVVGNGVAIVPAGLGIAEGVGAALAGLVGALPAAAFVVMGVNRLLGLAGSALVIGAFMLTSRPAESLGHIAARTG